MGSSIESWAKEDQEHALVREICNNIAAGNRESTEAEMTLYTNTIPGTNQPFVSPTFDTGPHFQENFREPRADLLGI